jgi:hypothetical protein
MCIFIGDIKDVSETKLFVSASAGGSRQLVVYTNGVDNESSGNAMILPVPHPETVKFIDMQHYKNFFDDCEKPFIGHHSSCMDVINFGSYQVSLARSLDALKQVLDLKPECHQLLSAAYSEPYWGFIICRISTGHKRYHPFAYEHKILGSNIFIPTMQSAWLFDPNYPIWDHTIYIHGIKNKILGLGRVASLKVDGIPFRFRGDLCAMITLVGNYPNIDLLTSSNK